MFDVVDIFGSLCLNCVLYYFLWMFELVAPYALIVNDLTYPKKFSHLLYVLEFGFSLEFLSLGFDQYR